MTRMDQVFKAYDIRGTVPDQLDATMCRAIGRAMARFAGAPEILIARDMRESGVALSEAFSDGVRAEGVAVTDLGMASTDFLYFAAGRLDAPGAMFTASHNPARYNGMKLCLSGARPIGRDTGLAEIQAIAESLLDEPPGPPSAPLRQLNLLDEWAEHVVSFERGGAIIVIPRLVAALGPQWPLGAVWTDTAIALPKRRRTRWYRDALKGGVVDVEPDQPLSVVRVLANFPVAVLVPRDDA